MESTPGVGSVFHFTMQLVRLAQSEGKSFTPASLDELHGLATTPTREPAGDCQMHILVAEDNLVNQRLAVALLEKAGHRVTLAKNGEQAIAKWRENAIDLILMDVQMPELDGFSATRQIRQEEHTSGTHQPIVAMTAHAMSGDRERCLQAGMDDYLSKPIRRPELLAVLAQFGKNRALRSVERKDTAQCAPHLDKHTVLSLLEGDHQLLNELINVFLVEADSMLAQIADAVTRQDAGALGCAAHRLQGAASIFDSRTVTEAALALEMMGRQCDLGDAANAFTRLERKMEVFEEALRELQREICLKF